MKKVFLFLTVAGLILAGYLMFGQTRHDYAKGIAGCGEEADSQKAAACWGTLFNKIIKKDGLAEATRVASETYGKQTGFSKNCHEIMHLLGQAAYEQFSKQGKIPVSEDNFNCAYGFFHGFMETLFGREGKIGTAKKLCDYVAGQFPYLKTDPGQCRHGIGHGVALYYEWKYPENPWQIIQPGLDVCEEVSQNQSEIDNCFNGVVDGIGASIIEKGLKNRYKIGELYNLCRDVPQQDKTSCYTGLSWFNLRSQNGDLAKAIMAVESVPERKYIPASIQAVGELSLTRFSEEHLPDKLSVCNALNGNLRPFCIKGLVSGIIHFGIPGRQSLEAASFCAGLPESEKNPCFGQLVDILGSEYSNEALAQACLELPSSYQAGCLQRKKE